jgi:hypothetical protein
MRKRPILYSATFLLFFNPRLSCLVSRTEKQGELRGPARPANAGWARTRSSDSTPIPPFPGSIESGGATGGGGHRAPSGQFMVPAACHYEPLHVRGRSDVRRRPRAVCARRSTSARNDGRFAPRRQVTHGRFCTGGVGVWRMVQDHPCLTNRSRTSLIRRSRETGPPKRRRS